MASFSLEEFVGGGSLAPLLPSLLDDGWDDVPTLKMMRSQDMDALQFTPQQRDALLLRVHLHDRSLMEYADQLEASGIGLPNLLNISPSVLSSGYGMKRGHVARFFDRSSNCGVIMPPNLTLPARRTTRRPMARSVDMGSDYSSSTPSVKTAASPPASSVTSAYSSEEGFELYGTKSDANFRTLQKERQAPPPQFFKGVVAAALPEPRLCGFVSPSPIIEDVSPLSVLETIYVQKLTPEYRPGLDLWGERELKMPPPMKASDIWASKATVIFCIRRPGCVMCRAEAHQLYSRKPIFDALGVQLVAVLNEQIDSEVRSFWPRFWGGMIVVDKNREFFKAMGGGVLPKDNLITGFIFNPAARANFRRARTTGIGNNLKGEATIKGGLLIIRPGKGGVAYQFIERNFGDWAPLEEVLEICGNLKQVHYTTDEWPLAF